MMEVLTPPLGAAGRALLADLAGLVEDEAERGEVLRAARAADLVAAAERWARQRRASLWAPSC